MLFPTSQSARIWYRKSAFPLLCVGLSALVGSLTGCGTTRQNTATEQLLSSDAVDAAVAKIDFTPMRGQLVYFDTKYMQGYKGTGFVTPDYVISSLRQQMLGAGVLLQEKADMADYILEGRVGTLGSDNHDVVVGIPASSLSAAAAAASAVSGTPAIQGMPELALSRRNDQTAAAKIGVFAYERVSREPVWQSGISVARSTAKDLWVLGIGPIQRGTIYAGQTRFAGEALNAQAKLEKREGINGTIASYRREAIFRQPGVLMPRQQVAEEKGEGNSERAGHAGIQQTSGEADSPGGDEWTKD
ncbi:DUF6655 family protein [Planctomicrobium sp. SH664]|uniref:DUF6655 family protein n=1 Tax=Planctomicrobium sp. SH664 TaxID=3448125 RepID=UPI003F5CB6C1